MNSEEVQTVAFNIILNAGNGKTKILESFDLMEKGEYDEAEKLLEESNEDLVKAHQSQTSLIQEMASGEDIEVNVILVHAQDHLMTTMTMRDIALQMLKLYKKIDEK